LRILAIDPGETTGWAYTDTEHRKGLLYSGHFPLWQDLYELIWFPFGAPQKSGTFGPELATTPVHVVIIEAFVLYPWAARSKSWHSFPTVEVIGVAKYLAAQADARVVMQPASLAKAKWLRRVRLQGNTHEVDAQKHLLVYLKREGLDEGYGAHYPQARKRRT
jgi:hypothetical protein